MSISTCSDAGSNQSELKDQYSTGSGVDSDSEAFKAEDKATVSSDDQDRPRGSRGSEAHTKGECRPCAYFWAQADGCRRGSDCDFCHLCDSDAMRNYKKAKKQRLKAEAAEERAKHIAKRRIERQTGGSGYSEAEPAHIDASIQIEPATYQSTSMFIPPMPTMPLFHPSPVMPPVPPMVAGMPGITPMPMAVPAQVTPLSAQSRPYVPVDSGNGSNEEVTSTVTKDRAAHLPKKTPSEIARAVASEVEKLVAVSFDVIAAQKLLAKLESESGHQKVTHQFTDEHREVDIPFFEEPKKVFPEVNTAMFMQLEIMAQALDSSNVLGGPSQGRPIPYFS